MFVCAGIARLARFNVTTAAIPHDASGKAKYFEGLPIPSSLILVGGMALCLLFGRVEPGTLPIPLQPATESMWNLDEGRTYRFFGSLARYLPDASRAALNTKAAVGTSLGSNVPLGHFTVNLSSYVATAIARTVGEHGLGLVSAKTTLGFARWGIIEGHYIAFLWLAWAMAMVSKTLHVPKP